MKTEAAFDENKSSIGKKQSLHSTETKSAFDRNRSFISQIQSFLLQKSSRPLGHSSGCPNLE